MRLAGKVAIISGAASSMGAATARMFAREGSKVVIGDVLEREGRQVADAIGASARFEPLDVTKEEGWSAVVAATTRHFGKREVLVNNAGISGSAEQDFYSTEAWHRIMAVNATGAALVHAFVEQPHATLLFGQGAQHVGQGALDPHVLYAVGKEALQTLLVFPPGQL